jgi:lipoprotein signal peptidase
MRIANIGLLKFLGGALGDKMDTRINKFILSFVDLEDNSLNINSYSFSIIPNYQKKNYDESTILN